MVAAKLIRPVIALSLLISTGAAQNAPPATLISTIATPAEITSLAMSRDGARVLATSVDRKLRAWSLPEGRSLSVIDIGRQGGRLHGVSDDGHLALLTAPGIGRRSDVASVMEPGNEKAHFEIQVKPHHGVSAISHDGRFVAISTSGEPVRVFDVRAGKEVYALEPVVGGTQAIAFSRGNSLIATGDGDTQVRIYNAVTGKLIARNTDLLLEPFTVDFTADGKQVLAAGADKAIVVIDASTGRLVRRVGTVAEPVGHLEISPDGHRLVTVLLKASGMRQPAPVLVWDLESGRKEAEWLPPVLPLGGGWTRDQHVLAVTAKGKTLQLWEIR
jgi:WD40 repeat protein